MSARHWLTLERARLLDQQQDPANLRSYPSVPAADDSSPPADADLRRQELEQRLRQEAHDEAAYERETYRSWQDRDADDAGQARWGELP